MKKYKKIIPLALAMTLVCTGLPLTVKADSSKVVTLGAQLSDAQKSEMYEYFGTSSDQVETITVTNADERKYMEGIASEAQIGTRTYSCSYVEPTTEGGIQVKTANLTFVTSSMIASTLMTSGVENCNVVAASPIEVSGTGALTGIMMAYETASGETLDEGQKEAATEELVTTGELADSIGQEKATDLMNDVKQEVIEDKLTDTDDIKDTVTDAADDLDVNLTDEQIDKITALMEKISQYDYNVEALNDTLKNLEGKADGFFAKVGDFFKGLFGGDDSDGGIINNTKDDILGSDIITDSTLDDIKSTVENTDTEGLWDKVVNFFKGLFGDDDAADDSTDDAADSTTNDTDTSNTGDTDTGNTTTNDSNTDNTGTTDDGSSNDDNSAETIQP